MVFLLIMTLEIKHIINYVVMLGLFMQLVIIFPVIE